MGEEESMSFPHTPLSVSVSVCGFLAFFLDILGIVWTIKDMNGFTLLWSKILDSSVWMESKETRLVWITLLAMKDSKGIVQAAVVGLAHRARVSVVECESALKTFLNPDPNSSSRVEDGRRIREIAGGWEIINHEQYRYSTDAKREFWREQKRKQRESVTEPKPARSRKRRVGKTATEIAMERADAAGDEEAVTRLSELSDGVSPGTYSKNNGDAT